MLPIDADMDDLRREARAEGRYRLDPIDVDNRAIASAPAERREETLSPAVPTASAATYHPCSGAITTSSMASRH